MKLGTGLDLKRNKRKGAKKMGMMTSAAAAKLLRKLNEEHDIMEAGAWSIIAEHKISLYGG